MKYVAYIVTWVFLIPATLIRFLLRGGWVCLDGVIEGIDLAYGHYRKRVVRD